LGVRQQPWRSNRQKEGTDEQACGQALRSSQSPPSSQRGALTDSGFTCATNMPPPGREVQAERLGTLPAYRVRCNPLLESDGRITLAIKYK
jgi:hypothetical protein